jgi:hypothetical protein
MTVWVANPSRQALRRDVRLLCLRSPLGRSVGSVSADSTGHKCVIANPRQWAGTRPGGISGAARAPCPESHGLCLFFCSGFFCASSDADDWANLGSDRLGAI